MFRKKVDTEVLNLFNTIENKIDIINSNFNCVTFLDGCCICKERDIKINEMLITFLESKFSELYLNESKVTKNELSVKNHIDSILIDIKTELQNKFVTKENQKSSLELLTYSVNNLTNEIQQLKQTPSSDKLLRSDLNTFLVAIKDDIKSDIKGSMQITLQNNTVLKNTLDILINKTDAIFYDNEIIKHQFSIEENVKNYSDTVDYLKISIEKSINDIDQILMCVSRVS